MTDVRGFKAVINYGLGKVRFPTPLREGKRLPPGAQAGRGEGGGRRRRRLLRAAVEVEGESKPTCAAELIFRFIG